VAVSYKAQQLTPSLMPTVWQPTLATPAGCPSHSTWYSPFSALQFLFSTCALPQKSQASRRSSNTCVRPCMAQGWSISL
jgi:hypothetical protein